jgi:hypothetical protein
MQRPCPGHVRFGSLADMTSSNRYVRFTPESGHQNRPGDRAQMPMPATIQKWPLVSQKLALATGKRRTAFPDSVKWPCAARAAEIL